LRHISINLMRATDEQARMWLARRYVTQNTMLCSLLNDHMSTLE